MKKVILAVSVLFVVLMAGSAMALPNWDISGTWALDYHYTNGENWHDWMATTFDCSTGAFSGSGGYPLSGPPYDYAWTITSGSVSGDAVEFTADYTSGATCSFHLIGTIAGDGLSMSGTWTDDCDGARAGTFTATGVAATVDCDVDGSPNTLDCNDADATVYPGAADAICDGVDNNCDLTPDDEYVSTPTSCGVGACSAAGETTCVAGVVGDTCVAGTPAAEVCDNLDNNCDGTVDESLTQPTSNQFGLCSGNTETCSAGSWIPDATNYAPVPETCDGLDNDCDAATDEELVTPLADKQLGVCAGALKVCDGTNGWIEPNYTLIADYEATETSCDTLDNDCNGAYDTHVCNWFCIPTTVDNKATMDPYLKLGVNRLIWTTGQYFQTVNPKGKTVMNTDYTLASTNSCSCNQILTKLHDYNPALYGDMLGHWKYGCSQSVMNEFIRLINPNADTLIGTWLLSVNGGAYQHDMFVVNQDASGHLTGTGGYPASGPPYNPGQDWTLTGQVTGTAVTMTITYSGGYTATITGTIVPWTSMSGGAGTGGVTGWSATRV